MGRLSKEEKMKRQAQKLQNEMGQQQSFVPTRTNKQKVVEELEQKGYRNISTDSVPMFHVDSLADVEIIRSTIDNRFSFGVKGACLAK